MALALKEGRGDSSDGKRAEQFRERKLPKNRILALKETHREGEQKKRKD